MKPVPRTLSVRRFLLTFEGRKQNVVRDQLFPLKPPGSRLWFSRTGVQHSPGSSTIELPSTLTKSGEYPPDRVATRLSTTVLPASCVPPPPEGHQIGARRKREPGNTILIQPYRRRVSSDRLSRDDSQLAAFFEGDAGLTPSGKTIPHSYSETRFRREE